MATTESEFIEIAKRLIDTYQRKIARLTAIVSEYESEAGGQQELDQIVTSRISTPIQPVKTTNGNEAAVAAKYPKKTMSWIRFGIEQNPENATVQRILNTIASISPATAAKFKSGWVSTGLYHLAKAGEIEAVSKSPGKPTTYRATSKFLTWIENNRRRKREKKENAGESLKL
jgi:chromosome segregation and condensation protein ScpB